MPTLAKFWDKVADKYAAQPVPDEEVYRIKLEMTREYLTPESEVYEFGCGTGSTAIAHAPYAKSILATDVSPRMIEIARDKAEKAHADNVSFQVAEFSETETPSDTYDMVMAHSILHLVDDLPGTLGKSHDMLKPGGIFVSSTVCLADRHWFMRPIIGLMRLVGKAPFVAFLKVSELEAHIQKAGFQIVQHWHPKGSMAVFLIAEKSA